MVRRGCRVPLVVMSAGRVCGAEAHNMRASAYLQKPFDVDTVIETVDHVVHGRN